MLARVQAHHVLGHLAALHGRHRRQGQLSTHVTGGIDVLHVGDAMLVDRDVATAIDFDARGLEVQAVAVGNRSDGQHHVTGAHLSAVVAFHHHGVAVAFDRLRTGTLQQRHTATQEVVLQNGGHLGVLAREHLLAADHQGHLGAERLEHVHEFHAGDARTHHAHAAREDLGRIAVTGGEDALAVGMHPIRNARTGTGGDQGGIEGNVQGLAVGGDHLGRRRRREAGRALQDAHALAGEQRGRAAREMFLDVLDALGESLHVDLRPNLLQTHSLNPSAERHRSAGGDHGLGRDAIEKVGRSTHQVAFDHGDVGAQSGGIGGRGVAGRTATDDQKAHCHAMQVTGRRPSGRVTSRRDPSLRP